MSDSAFANPSGNAGTAAKGRSLWDDARRRFLQNRAAVISLIVLVLIIALAVIGPSLAA